MGTFSIVLGLAAVAAGVVAIVVALTRPGPLAVDFGEVLGTDVEDHVDDFERKLEEPLRRRVSRALTGGVLGRLERLMPGPYSASVQRKLLLAGKGGTPPAEFVATQAALTGGLALLSVGWVALAHPPTRFAVLAIVLLPLVGAMLPHARLNRQVSERQQAMLMDLPDTLDLLAISVEAGMGFEGALDVVCQYFHSPHADEFSLTLREMELGLPRRDAFQNLKGRTNVAELSNFVLALLQADALGMPIGRVLKTQAVEMRSRRRLWAREKAGKLPVKILFPLVLFIFPPMLVILMGPAAGSIGKAFQ